MKRIDICTINLNEGEGRQTISYDPEDMMLYSSACEEPVNSDTYSDIEDATKACEAMWGPRGGRWWALEWVERYYINYHTGAGDKLISGTLDDAKQAADSGACYTQRDITIEDEDGNEICRRRWWGVAYDEDEGVEESPITFGAFGYYGDWSDE